MQFFTIITALAITVTGAMAAPGNHPPPPPPPPHAPPPPPSPPANSGNNHQVNYCSSGDPFCCSPTDSSDYSKGTTCAFSTTSCSSTSICCNNAALGQATAQQTCVAGLIGPVVFVSVNAN